MLTYVHQFFGSLVFSILVEGAVVLLLCVLFKKRKKVAIIAVLGTILTIPYVWFIFPTLFWYSASLTLFLGEGFAFLTEAVFYKLFGKVGLGNALLFSFFANSASYLLGRIL